MNKLNITIAELLKTMHARITPIEEDVFIIEASLPNGGTVQVGFFNGMPLGEFAESMNALVAGVIKGASQ